MRTRDIAIGLALSGLLAAVVALTVPAPEPLALAPPAPLAASMPAAAAPPRGAALPPTPPAAAQAAGTRWREMHAKFVRARNLREFFYEAMRQPENGAVYYATQALFACGRALEQDLASLPPARRRAASELQRRCDFTRDGLQDAKRELEAARHLDLGGDPLLDTVFDYLAADGAEGKAAMLSAAFEQGNPEIIASLLSTAVVENMPPAAASDTDSTARGIPFGGALLACRLGADCGPGALRTLELCMQQGWCADSVPAALQQGLGANFAQLDAVAMRVVNDVRQRNLKRLVPRA